MTKQFLTIRQLCDRWLMSRQSVARKIADQTLQAVNVGGEESGSRWRIPLESIEEFERERANFDKTMSQPAGTLRGVSPGRRRPPPKVVPVR